MDHYAAPNNMSFRLNILVPILYLLAVPCIDVKAQIKSQNRITRPTENPKCIFLRHEAERARHEGYEYFNQSSLASIKTPDDLTAAGETMTDWAKFTATNEVFAARETLLRLDTAACEHSISLADTSRVNDISRMRTKQVQRLLNTWRRLAGDQGKYLETDLTSPLNAVYEAETRSFYNPEISQFDDPDIGKDYPDLIPAIQNSVLDQNTKTFYVLNARFLRYEEAGTLANILKGIDTSHGLDFAYLLRKRLADRATVAAQKRDQISRQQQEELRSTMTTYAIEALAVLFAIVLLWIWGSRAAALRRGIRTGATRSPYWGGNAEWVFWEPGETVVLLEHKRLIPMRDPQGGYRSISAWRGQEYKGKISYKTQFSTWKSDPILTSDGLAVNLGLSVWWKIADAAKFVSGVAADYHKDSEHYAASLSTPEQTQSRKEATDYWTKEAAEFWIRKLAAGTLREQINQLPAEKLISPYVQAYIQIAQGPDGASEAKPIPNFSDQLGKVQEKLNEKTLRYGIEIDRLEVAELILPAVYQQKLEAVRVAFLEPTQQRALTEAQKIALRGLAEIIGPDRVGLIEVLKHVDLSQVTNPVTGVVSFAKPIADDIQRQTEKALPPISSQAAAANASLPPASGDGKSK